MGMEATCEARFGGEVSKGTLHFEPPLLLFRGAFRLKVPLAEVKDVEAKAGTLSLRFGASRATFHLGKDAETWALKIRYPKSRLDKLGVKPGMRVAVIGVDDVTFHQELKARASDVTRGKSAAAADLVFVGMTKTADLPRLEVLARSIQPAGAIWVVWPKGRKEFREDDVRAYGPTAGLVDVKVVAFSETLSGLKLVIPVKDRPKAGKPGRKSAS